MSASFLLFIPFILKSNHNQIKSPPDGGLFIYAASFSFFRFICEITASSAVSKLSSNDLEDCLTKNSYLGI